MPYRDATALIHLASGVGNIVLATPLILLLSNHGFVIDLLLDPDYPETAELLCGWGAIRAIFPGQHRVNRDYAFVVPAIPPFYWDRFKRGYMGEPRCVRRPDDRLFYEDEQAYYLAFAKHLGLEWDSPPYYFLPIASKTVDKAESDPLVIAPGCKTGKMAAKRWPFFAELAERFDNVVVVGTPDDLCHSDGTKMTFPTHARSLVGQLTLRETAELLVSARVVVANDSGLGHVAGAVGAPTILLFGPTPDRTLGRFPPNVRVLRAGLECEPCWLTAPLHACSGSIACLRELEVSRVVREVNASWSCT